MDKSWKMKLAFTAFIIVLLWEPWHSGVYACGNIRKLCKYEWDTCAIPSKKPGMADSLVNNYIDLCCRVILGLRPSDARLPPPSRRSVTEESTEMRADLIAFATGTRQEPINQDSSTDSNFDSNTESSEAAGQCSQLLSECKKHVTATEINTYLDRGELDISLTSAFSDVDPMQEMVARTSSSDSNLELNIESLSATSPDSETNDEVPVTAMTNETEIPMTLKTTRTNERECVEGVSQESIVTVPREVERNAPTTTYTEGRENAEVAHRNEEYSSVTLPKEVDANAAESDRRGTLGRGEFDNNFMFSLSDLESGPRSEPVGLTDSRDSNLELHIETQEATRSESETDVKIPVNTGTDGNEIESYHNAAYTDGQENFAVAKRDEEYLSETVPKEAVGNDAGSDDYRTLDRGELDNSLMFPFSDIVSSTRNEPIGQTDSRDSNLELHLEMSESTSSESETDVKIPVNIRADQYEIERYLNAAYTDNWEGNDYVSAFGRGEPDGESSDDANVPAAAVQTRPIVTADEYRENRQRYTAEWLSSHCVSSMEVLINDNDDLYQCFETLSETDIPSDIPSFPEIFEVPSQSQRQRRQQRETEIYDNQTMSRDWMNSTTCSSFDSEYLFGSGHG